MIFIGCEHQSLWRSMILELIRSSSRTLMRFVALATVPSLPLVGLAQWRLQSSGTQERLRAVSAVSPTVAWASGNRGTCLRTTDGGRTWRALNVPDADSLDFRDVEAFDAHTASLLSIGPGERSRI